MSYDLAIAYRIYPKVSRVSPVFTDDKLKLSDLCLRSFRQGLGHLRAKMYVLLDACPPEFEAIFQDYFASNTLELIRLPAIGNRPSFGRQIDLLLSQTDSEFVYFAEDDYFYRPNALFEMVQFMQKNTDAHFMTPYDHPDSYRLPLHPRAQEIRAFGGREWRTCASTCLTFLSRKSILAQTERTFRTYQRTNLDVSLWMALTKQTALNPIAFARCCLRKLNYGGYIAQSWRYSPSQLLFGPKWKLWRGLPSLATHMVEELLAPGVEWTELLATGQK
jgi:hypothetical protein